MKNILVAMDLNPACDRAFERAVRLARRHNAELTVIHVIDEQVLGYEIDDSDLAPQLIARAEAKLRRHWADRSGAGAPPPRLIVRIGSPWEDILGAAADVGADLIVLGIHRINPLKDIFIGTTSERIIRHSTLPVLVVRDKPASEYTTAIVATDFSAASGRALGAALDVAADADIRVLHVFETPFPAFIRLSRHELAQHKDALGEKVLQDIHRDLETFLKSRGEETAPRVTPMIEQGSTISQISAVLDDEQADLLVLGTHGRGGMAGALLGSVALTFLNDCPCDVLISR